MTYSRKGFWITMGLFWAVTLCAVAAVLVFHPRSPIAMLIAIAMMLAGFPLAMRAVFFQDEVQRQARMRDWYFGSQAGLLAAGMVMILFVSTLPATLQPLMDGIFGIHSHEPAKYLAMGFLLSVVGQAVGTYFLRGMTALRFRS